MGDSGTFCIVGPNKDFYKVILTVSGGFILLRNMKEEEEEEEAE